MDQVLLLAKEIEAPPDEHVKAAMLSLLRTMATLLSRMIH